MLIKGRAFCFKDNVNTDEIIPARYLTTSDPHELAKNCMEDCSPGFGQREDIRGGIIVAGKNFGCGSSREHAPISIKYSQIKCVIAKSFARIFLRNCINIGLVVVELKETDEIEESDQLEVNLSEGRVKNLTKNKVYNISDYPPFMQGIIKAGGWMKYANEIKGGVYRDEEL